MGYGFKCPKCGGFKWGTLDCGKPKQEWIGTCNGDRDYPGCGFRWHRATEDEKIIGIPFGVHDKRTKSSSVHRRRRGGMYSTARKCRQRPGNVAIK